MSTTDTGGPAFPIQELNHDGTPYFLHTGISMLDYFAAKAMQGELAAQSVESGHYEDFGALASRSYKIAEAMLEQKKARQA